MAGTNIIEISRRLPNDQVAQEFAHEAMAVSDRIGEIFDDMPYRTVSGALTREGLRKAKELLESAADVLSDVLKREIPKYESYTELLEREEARS